MADNEQKVVPHVQVELAVLFADKTWSNEHMEYVPAISSAGNWYPSSAVKDTAVFQLEEKLKDNALVSLIVVYSINCGGQYYTAGGEKIPEVQA